MRRCEEARKRTGTSGFTFIELLVTILIISILATTVGVVVRHLPGKARVAQTRAQIGTLKVAMEMYHADQGRFPSQEQGLPALCRIPTIPPVPTRYPEGGYLESLDMPKDAWGNDFAYFLPGRGGKPYEIVSYGGDGEPGGSGEDADISSLEL